MYLPANVFPDWPGNDDANKKLEDTGSFKDPPESDEGVFKDNFEYFLPPSIKDLPGEQILWL